MGEMSTAGKSIMVQDKDVLRKVLKSEKDPEVKRRLSFLSLVGSSLWSMCFHRLSTAGTLKVRLRLKRIPRLGEERS